MSTTLRFLTEGDWQQLRARAIELPFERDAIIVREGDDARGVMVLKTGAARVEQARDGVGITLARMGAGEVFGEMSLLEDTKASASVIADEAVVVELFERTHVEALLQSDPGFASRLHRSIAVHLSRRLRDRSRAFAQLEAQVTGQRGGLHAPRLGRITARQIPKELVAGVDDFRKQMTMMEARLGVGVDRQVDEACARLLALLDRHTGDEALFEIGYSDLGSFRDPGQLATGIGAYVFRQTFSWFMSAATMARVYMKPRGFAEDYETMELIHRNEPEGDGAVGPLLDRWYLARPVCRSRRAGREHARAWLRRLAGEARQGQPLSIASFASGTGAEAITILAEPAGKGARLTCVDLDHEALGSGASLARELGVGARVAFAHGSVVPSEEREGAASIGRHHAAYALGLIEYLSDDECVRMFDWAHDALLPKGTFAVSTLAPSNPDRAFLEHILEWRPTHRSDAELTALFARSRFTRAPRIEPDGSGAGLFAVVEKG